MDKKKGIMIASVICVICLAIIAALAIIKLLDQKNAEVTVSFDTNGGETIESMKVKKGSEVTLPTTEKEGYNFLGWYDENNKKMESTVTITRHTKFHAQWEEIPKANNFTVTFDSAGGSAVNKLVVECGKELTLPTAPSKEGYTFVTWQDEKETPILDKALLECSDITLYAKWEKKAEEKKETTKKEETKPVEKPKVYTCPDGYTLEGTKCTIGGTVHETCPSDTKADGTLCIRTSDRNAGERQCKEDTVSIDGKGHTWTGRGDYYLAGFGHCAYYKWTNITSQSECTTNINRKATWVSVLNGCYAEVKYNNYETICSGDYQYYSSEELSSKFGIHDNGQCLRKVAKTKYCEEGYTLTSGKCIKTIDATLQ